MKAKENTVYRTLSKFTEKIMLPEGVLYGYAKVILMSPSAKEVTYSSEERKELDECMELLKEKKLDPEMIKLKISSIIPNLWVSMEEMVLYDRFFKYMDTDNDASSRDILQRAIELTIVPLQRIFSLGSDQDNYFSWMEEIKKRQGVEGYYRIPIDRYEEGASKEASDDISEGNKEKGSGKEENDMDLGTLSRENKRLVTALLAVVKGQDRAILKFTKGIFRGQLLGQTAPFFFFGPPGVGKTLLAETAAKEMGLYYKRFNMSEYSYDNDGFQLFGADPSYKNAHEGLVTKILRENPRCILIFDEIEKANTKVHNFFLQILGSGEYDDDFTKDTISCRDAIIIFTSNVGTELYQDRSTRLSGLPDRVLINTISKDKRIDERPTFSEAFCSRIASGNVIMFDHLPLKVLIEITRMQFDIVTEKMKENYGCDITYSDELPLMFLYRLGSGMDARIVSGRSRQFLADELHGLIVQLGDSRLSEEKLSSVHFFVDRSDAEESIQDLFAIDEKQKLLLIARPETAGCIDTPDSMYTVRTVESIDEIKTELQHDYAAILIDPLFGRDDDAMCTISSTDYSTEGIRILHKLAGMHTGVPIVLTVNGLNLSETDRSVFCEEGVDEIIDVDPDNISGTVLALNQYISGLTLERKQMGFCEKGFVLDYNSKQKETSIQGRVDIVFYELKKRKAIEAEDREFILSEKDKPNIGFDDVIGAAQAKRELEFFAEFIKNPKHYVANGGKPPKGIMLYGPPGTGKTLLARALAGEADACFIETTATRFFDSLVGNTEKNIRDLFRRARQYAPSIIFIDEIDAIGKQRTGSDTDRHRESALNQLLTEMDGFVQDINHPVFVLAATNFGVRESSEEIGRLDEALMRRFANRVYVGLPERKEREEFLKKMINRYDNADVSSKTIENIAQRTPGMSFAIMQNVIELAERNALREDKGMDNDLLLNALEEYLHGEKKEYSSEYYEGVAVHEAGHAVISWINGNPPRYITIESRADYAGYMSPSYDEKNPLLTKDMILGRIRGLLAGRAAEEVFFGEELGLNTGASSDLKMATELAYDLMGTYGMKEGRLATLSRKEMLSAGVAERHLTEVNELLDKEMRETVRLAQENRVTIRKVADVLIEKNRMTGDDFLKLVDEK